MQLSVSGRYDEWRLPVPRGSMQEVSGQPSRLVFARVFLPFCEVAQRAGTVILLAFCEVARQSGSGTCRTGRRDSCTIRCGFASTLGDPSSPSSDLRLARARRRQSRAPTGPHRSYVMSPLAVTQDQPARLPADTVAAERPAATPGRFTTREQFRLRCADAHPVGCDVELVSSSRDDVVSRACAHGASAHGFTPVWYSPGRLAAIAAEVDQTGRARATGQRP